MNIFYLLDYFKFNHNEIFYQKIKMVLSYLYSCIFYRDFQLLGYF